MASRPYGWETINRNVIALQRPGALEDTGANDTNVFLVHVDAKLGEARKHELRDVLITPRPDVYMLRRPRPVLWAGWSMILALFDAMASVVRRGLHFEYFINLSDADLTLRTDAELRAFFARQPVTICAPACNRMGPACNRMGPACNRMCPACNRMGPAQRPWLTAAHRPTSPLPSSRASTALTLALAPNPSPNHRRLSSQARFH
eukprot:scaffold70079_cov62-Phaeocystis_antarctica.AAC.3